MAPSWKSLPAHLSDPARLLTERLRELKDVRSLSLSEIARRTHYSKASWQRWFNGERLITAQALEALLTQVGGDAEALRALLAQADALAPADGGTPVPVPAAPPDLPQAATAPPEDLRGDGAADRRDTPVARTGRSALGESRFLLSVWSLATIVVLAVVCVFLLVDPPVRAGTTRSQAAAPSAGALNQNGLDCRGIGCIGKDPQLAGCGTDAVTLLSANVGKVILDVRYSPSCRAAWAKLTNGAPRDTATITTNTGQSATALIHWGHDAYSPMVDASGPKVVLKVCGDQPQGQGCTVPVSDPSARRWPSPAPSASSPPPKTAASPIGGASR